MKTKQWKRIWSLVLVLVMVLGMIPTKVYAADDPIIVMFCDKSGTVYESTLQIGKATKMVAGGTTVNLTTNNGAYYLTFERDYDGGAIFIFNLSSTRQEVKMVFAGSGSSKITMPKTGTYRHHAAIECANNINLTISGSKLDINVSSNDKKVDLQSDHTMTIGGIYAEKVTIENETNITLDSSQGFNYSNPQIKARGISATDGIAIPGRVTVTTYSPEKMGASDPYYGLYTTGGAITIGDMNSTSKSKYDFVSNAKDATTSCCAIFNSGGKSNIQDNGKTSILKNATVSVNKGKDSAWHPVIGIQSKNENGPSIYVNGAIVTISDCVSGLSDEATTTSDTAGIIIENKGSVAVMVDEENNQRKNSIVGIQSKQRGVDIKDGIAVILCDTPIGACVYGYENTNTSKHGLQITGDSIVILSSSTNVKAVNFGSAASSASVVDLTAGGVVSMMVKEKNGEEVTLADGFRLGKNTVVTAGTYNEKTKSATGEPYESGSRLLKMEGRDSAIGGTVTYIGTGEVGTVLGANVDKIQGPKASELTYRWFAMSDEVGSWRELQGEENQNINLTDIAVGTKLYVEVSATGYSGSVTGAVVTVIDEIRRGATVSGTITSHFSETEDILVSLLAEDDMYQTSVNGNEASYSFENVAEGTYTLQVEKKDHVVAEYEVTVGTEDVTQDVTLQLLGDVNKDEEISAADALMVLRHCVKLISLDEQQSLAADVSGEGEADVNDALYILKYAVKLIDSFSELRETL